MHTYTRAHTLTDRHTRTHLAGDDHGRVGLSVLEVEVVLAVLQHVDAYKHEPKRHACMHACGKKTRIQT